MKLVVLRLLVTTCILLMCGVYASSVQELQPTTDLDKALAAVEEQRRNGADITPVMNSRMRKGWLLFCENGLDIAETYSGGFNARTTLVDTVMSRMCRFAAPEEKEYEPMWPDSNTSLVVEEYGYLPVDEGLCMGGPFSSAFSMVTREEFLCWEDIKLYLHNGMHAFVSYHAFLEGVQFFKDTPVRIREWAHEVVLREVVPAIVNTHPDADGEKVQQYGLKLLERFFNPYFNDSTERGTRGIDEKLAPGERLVGGCEYIMRAGIEPKGYARTIDAAARIKSIQEA